MLPGVLHLDVSSMWSACLVARRKRGCAAQVGCGLHMLHSVHALKGWVPILLPALRRAGFLGNSKAPHYQPAPPRTWLSELRPLPLAERCAASLVVDVQCACSMGEPFCSSPSSATAASIGLICSQCTKVGKCRMTPCKAWMT
jgi:hypothetical protein